MRIALAMLTGAICIGLLALIPGPGCGAASPHGARIGGVILIGDCR